MFRLFLRWAWSARKVLWVRRVRLGLLAQLVRLVRILRLPARLVLRVRLAFRASRVFRVSLALRDLLALPVRLAPRGPLVLLVILVLLGRPAQRVPRALPATPDRQVRKDLRET